MAAPVGRGLSNKEIYSGNVTARKHQHCFQSLNSAMQKLGIYLKNSRTTQAVSFLPQPQGA
jgi:hypothetical protein